MNYNTGINWDLFFDQVDLIHDDKPIYIKNFLPNPEKLASWEDVEKALNNYGAKWEIIKNNQNVNIPKNFLKWSEEYFDKSFIHNCINKGETFVIEKYSIQNDYARSICKEIEDLFPVITDIHVYGSKGNISTSFPYHYDLPANFIIQTYGECNWKVFNNSISTLLEITKYAPNPNKLTPIIETILTPGDMLYIPSRYHHAAFPNQSRLSASIPCYPGTEGRWDKNYYKI
jgi:hypothetical protein